MSLHEELIKYSKKYGSSIKLEGYNPTSYFDKYFRITIFRNGSMEESGTFSIATTCRDGMDYTIEIDTKWDYEKNDFYEDRRNELKDFWNYEPKAYHNLICDVVERMNFEWRLRNERMKKKLSLTLLIANEKWKLEKLSEDEFKCNAIGGKLINIYINNDKLYIRPKRKKNVFPTYIEESYIYSVGLNGDWNIHINDALTQIMNREKLN